MKKFTAILLCIAVICTLSVSAFAEEKTPSPENPTKVVITVRAAIDASGKVDNKSYSFQIEGNKAILKADPARGDFNGWSIYTKDYKPAVEGTDYKYVSGNKNEIEVSIEALVDGLIICANYNGKVTDPSLGSEKSPKTADMTGVFVMVSMLAALATVYSAKKVLSK